MSKLPSIEATALDTVAGGWPSSLYTKPLYRTGWAVMPLAERRPLHPFFRPPQFSQRRH